MPGTRWILAPEPAPIAAVLADALELSPVTADLLAQRLPEPSVEAARAFLRPSLANLHSPWQLSDMDAAAERIVKAIRGKEAVVVYGDYDTDGVTATALLLRILRALGHAVEHHLPCRLEEGYGISEEFTARAIEDKVNLVITVDCGISEHDKIRRLTAGGVDVIVTDHHEPGADELPPALAVVNPKRQDSAYPFREMTGVGVAFKLAWAVCERMVGSPRVGDRLQEALLGLLPLVAVGTIADVAPLVDENRIFVAHGLQAFRRGSAGLRVLMDTAGLQPERLTVRDIAFGLAPRLNAAGRMGDAQMALELLMEEAPDRAADLASQLDRQNTQRQKLCQTIKEEALAAAHATHDVETDAALVVAKDGWHEGVIGIVAGRLAEDFGMPAVVIALSEGEDKGKGSARSVAGLNLYEAMSHSRQRFLTFGGHEQAAGFSIMRQEIDAFRAELDEQCRRQIQAKQIEPQLAIDAALSLGVLNDALLRELQLLAPFGNGNPSPRFVAHQVRVVGNPKLMGRENRHFSFNASQDGVAYRAVVFNNTDWLHEIDAGARTWDVVFSPALNDFWSPPRLELRVAEMRPV